MTVILLAHGSADPRHAADVSAIATRLSAALGEPVRAGYLDHCGPTLTAAIGAEEGVTVVPLLLAPGYHLQHDVPAEVAPLVATGVVAEVTAAPLLTDAAAWAHDLVAELGPVPLLLVSAGSRDPNVLAGWQATETALGVPIVHASGLGPQVGAADCAPATVVPLVIARGYFSDRIAELAAPSAVLAPVGHSRALLRQLVRLVVQARARRSHSSKPVTPISPSAISA